ncbi:MAG: type II secretion system protein GspN [Deltaproteobacteria bacterium]|nr:type II secretion system protein GspN [Deltaproteobacteria bacterium]
MINLSSRQLRIIKWIGYPAFFVCSFLFFMALTFPADRFLPIAEAKLTEVLGREVTINDLSISPFGSVSLTGVAIEVPTDEEELKKKNIPDSDAADVNGGAGGDTDSDASAAAAPKPIVPRYHIDEMNVRVGIWSLIFGDLDVEVDADFLGGNILVKYKAPLSSDDEADADEAAELATLTPAERVKLKREQREQEKAAAAAGEVEPGKAVSFSVVATDLNLIQFWDLKDLLPLPMFGNLDFGIEIKTETGKMADAAGKMWVDGRDISLGEGQSKIEVIDGMGPMTVDAFSIKSLLLEMSVNEGKCAFGKVNMASSDLAATAQGDIQFTDPMSQSRLNLYFTFKLLDGYAQKSSTAQTLVSLMPSALAAAKRTDGYYGYGYRGTFKTARFRPQKFFNDTDRTQRTPVTTRRNARPAQRPSPAARPRPVSPELPPTSVMVTPSHPPIVTTPTPEMMPDDGADDEPEEAPELDQDSITARPSVNIKEMSDRMQERQAESERLRMEATLKTQREIEESAVTSAEEEEEAAAEPAEEDGPSVEEAEENVEVEGEEGGEEAEEGEAEENGEEEENEE